MTIIRSSHFSSNLLRIALCQTVSGTELDVKNAINDLGAECLVSFNEYDLIGLIPCSLKEVKEETWQPYEPFLREYDEVLCFSWEKLTKPLDSVVKAGAAITISFLKIDEDLLRIFGVNIELEFVRWFNKFLNRKNKDSIKATIYGTFGWTELVVIWATPTFEVVANELVNLRNLKAKELSLKTKDITPSSLDLLNHSIITASHSLPCVRSGESVYDLPEEVNKDAILNASIFVVAASNSDAKVAEFIRSHPQFSKEFHVLTSFGYYDLVVEPQSKTTTLSQIINLLSALRNLGPETIFSTNVHIGSPIIASTLPDSPGVVGNGSTGISKRDTTIKDAEALYEIVETLRNFEAEIGNPLLKFSSLLYKMLARYYTSSSINELRGLNQDLGVFLDEIILEADLLVRNSSQLPVITPHLRRIYDSFETAHQLFQYAFDQRVSGAQVGMVNTTSKVTNIRSAGIQRILTAARGVPNKLLWEFEEYGPLWKGFVVFGFENEVLKKDFGIMNIPAASLFDPAEWWSLGHEAGHDFAEILELLSRPDVLSLIEKAEANCKNAPDWPGNNVFQTREELEDVVEELIAEAFSFQFACNKDWDIYRDLVWSYLEEYLEGRQSIERGIGYILRSVFVYFYHIELEGGLQRVETVRNAIRKGKELNGQVYTLTSREPYYQIEGESLPRNIAHRAFSRYDDVSHLIETFIIPQIAEAAPKISSLISEINPKLIAYWYENFEPLRSLLIDIFNKLGANSQVESMPNLKIIKQRLKKGQLCLSNKFKPIEIVLALKQLKIEFGYEFESEARWSQITTAGLLSLWHLEKITESLYFSIYSPLWQEDETATFNHL